MALMFNRPNRRAQSSMLAIQEVKSSSKALLLIAVSMTQASLIGRDTSRERGECLLPYCEYIYWKHGVNDTSW